MLRPRSYRVKLIELPLHRFLFNVFAVERASKNAAQRVGENFKWIGHEVKLLIRPKKSEAAVTQTQENCDTKIGLDPVVDASSRVLILGTLPGDESLRRQRYYSHGRNDFWTILSRVYGEVIGADYGERLTFLRRHGIALWDVLASADRPGSLDSDIKEPVVNDFGAFFADYPNIERVGLNGTKADELFGRLVAKRFLLPSSLQIARLPSSSPTAGKHVCSLDEKVARWHPALIVARIINGEKLPASTHPREVVEALADDGVLRKRTTV